MPAAPRPAARAPGLPDRPFVQDGPRLTWWTWTGSRIQRTLAGLGRSAGTLDVRDDGIALRFARATEAEVREAYRRFLDACPAAEELAPLFPHRGREKYEPFLSEALQARSFARDALDLAGALEMIRLLERDRAE
jgi:hypothetical protein